VVVAVVLVISNAYDGLAVPMPKHPEVFESYILFVPYCQLSSPKMMAADRIVMIATVFAMVLMKYIFSPWFKVYNFISLRHSLVCKYMIYKGSLQETENKAH